MKITVEELKKIDACDEAVEWVKQQNTTDIHELYELAKRNNHLDWANWLVVEFMDKEQQIKYAIFAVESVLHIFEKKYPNDDRPRKAIQAAKDFLENPSDVTAARAARAADAGVGAAGVAGAATRVAYAAVRTANIVVAADARAAAADVVAAADVAARATVADDARVAVMIKFIDYGLELIGEKHE